MLTVDMADEGGAEPEHLVARHCSRFGGATIIHLLPPDHRREYGIAAVKMRTAVEADNVARKFGDARSGSVVLIKLVPQRRTIPLAPRRSSSLDAGNA